MSSPDLDGVLRSTLSTPLTPAHMAALDARLRARLAASGRRRTFPTRRIALVIAALLLLAPLVYGASAALRSTEDPNGLASASAFQAEIDAAKRVVPLPADATWPPYLRAQDPSGSYSAGGGRTWVEFVAFCSWSRSWLDARSSGATASETRALDVLTTTPTWEFYTGAFATQSQRDGIDRVLAGVRSGDAAPVSQFVALNCGP
jgi:hypothetical protein